MAIHIMSKWIDIIFKENELCLPHPSRNFSDAEINLPDRRIPTSMAMISLSNDSHWIQKHQHTLPTLKAMWSANNLRPLIPPETPHPQDLQASDFLHYIDSIKPQRLRGFSTTPSIPTQIPHPFISLEEFIVMKNLNT